MFQEIFFTIILAMNVLLLTYSCIISISRDSVVVQLIPGEVTPTIPPLVTIHQERSGPNIVSEVIASVSEPEVLEALEKNAILYRLVIDFIHENKKLIQPYGLARFIEKDILRFNHHQTPICELDIFQLTVPAPPIDCLVFH